MRRMYLPRRDRRLTIEEQDQLNYEEGRHEDRAAQSPTGDVDHPQGSSVPSSPWLQCPRSWAYEGASRKGVLIGPPFGQWIKK